jgi:hypothetical protein
MRRDRSLFLSVPVSERKTIVPGKIGIRLPAIGQTAGWPHPPRRVLGPFHSKNEKPGFWPGSICKHSNVMKREHLRSE